MLPQDIPSSVGATLVINLDAVTNNYRKLQLATPHAETAAVVKADAYGLGAARVAPALWAAGCRTFFVAMPKEGLTLRSHLPDEASIVVLNGPAPSGCGVFIKNRLMPVLNDFAQIEDWRSTAPLSAPPAILHVDTGMTRLGLTPADIARLSSDPARVQGIKFSMVMSHLACADEPDHELNEIQRTSFAQMRAALTPVIGAVPASLANSSGIYLGSDYHLQMVRPGVAIYGVNANHHTSDPVEQVIHLYGRVQQVRKLDKDLNVGYGATYRAHQGTRIATVAVGYADGYFRALSNRGRAFISATAVPLIGRVSMDLITLDVSTAPEEAVYPGAAVELIGTHISVDEFAEMACTNSYEVLTALGTRYHRVYKGGEA